MSRRPLPPLLLALPLVAAVTTGVDAQEPVAEPPGHWAFKPLEVTADTDDIDVLVRRRLAAAGIEPARRADRRTLIRRLYLDLTGLPPPPDEVAAFVANPSTDAYRRLVARLLDSPHYAERWARQWLDHARYADSDGYEKDNVRPHAWRWRDWVIDAIRDDVPFDRFVIEQIAGDLLPDASESQSVATGFHRNTLTNREGGVDQEEYRVKAVVDRVNTTGSVLLGLTIGCAECHDHKYDPITQREYFGLYAFFNDADEHDVDVRPTPREQARYSEALTRWTQQHDALRARVDADRPRLLAALREWESEYARTGAGAWHVLRADSVGSTNGATLELLDDASIRASGDSPPADDYAIFVEADLRDVTGFRVEVLTDDSLVDGGPGRTRHGNFVLSEFEVAADQTWVPLVSARATHEQRGYPIANAIDGAPDTGWAIQPQYHRNHQATFATASRTSGSIWTFRLQQRYGSRHTLGRVRIAARTGAMPNAVVPNEIESILATPDPERSTEQTQELVAWFARIEPRARELAGEIDALESRRPRAPVARAMTIAGRPEARTTRIHERGDFMRPGDAVEPNTPSILPPLRRDGGRPDRLDLARWIVDADNPLTPRVAVNHVWRHLFGHGIVRTPGDFGTRGEPPTHPLLLDALARWFVESGWSRKRLIERIVMSETYRQSARHRPELRERDPLNRLLARQNRFRVEAEIVRDLYLGVSGLLSPRVGGPSVRPRLPDGIADLGYARSVKWPESGGDDRYRRGLYVHFQRTVPYPMLVAFDCPDMAVANVRRERSNSPLQALTTLNDPVLVDCVRAFARRILAERPAASTRERIARMFEHALARPPELRETDAIRGLLERQLRDFAGDPDAAVRVLGDRADDGVAPVELAAWIAVARVVLNLDEFLTRP